MKSLNEGGVKDNVWIEDNPDKSRKEVLQCKYYVGGKVAVEIDFTNKRLKSEEHIKRVLASPNKYVKFYYRLNNQLSSRRLACYQDEIMCSEDITLEELKLKCLLSAKELGWNIKKILV